jgi:hypothetical protein
MGGFLNGVNDQLSQMQQMGHQKQVMNLFERMNQNMPREDPLMQGPMPSIFGLSQPSLMDNIMRHARGGMNWMKGLY